MSRHVAHVLGLGLALLTYGALVSVGCKDDATPTVLQKSDLHIPDSGLDVPPFDKNNIVDTPSFVDYQSITRDQVQTFFAKSPYSRSSFLETYQSNGIRASDAVVAAATKYHINPLVFLVLFETAQGLIGARDYVFPPERVEYIFGCGCLQADNCLPDQAGLDKQLDCLGAQFRQDLTEIADPNGNNETAGGWGPQNTSTTLDNQKISPANEATAVIYDHNPRLDLNGGSGSWIFWNLWNIYAQKLNYFGARGIDGKTIGDACGTDAECAAIEGATCASGDNYPGGMCIYDCTSTGQCPTQNSFCAQFKDGDSISAFCVPTCNRGAAATGCRDGYDCLHVKGKDDASFADICFAKTN